MSFNTGKNGSLQYFSQKGSIKSLYALVDTLSDSGIVLTSRNGSLSYKVRKGGVDSYILNSIKAHKDQLLLLLSENDKDRENVNLLPMSELQQSYWIGGFERKGVKNSDHWYNQFEIECLDLNKLDKALKRIIVRHDYLRSYVDSNGFLRIMDNDQTFTYGYVDSKNCENVPHEINKIKEKLCEPLPADCWPLYRMVVQQVDNRFIVHVGGRILLGDAMSWSIYADELGLLLHDPMRNDLPDSGSLSVIILNRFRNKLSPGYQVSLGYWRNRHLPAAPILPVRSNDIEFFRLKHDFSKKTSDSLTEKAKLNGLTLDSVFMALYSLLLDKWSTSSVFSINVLHGILRHSGCPLGNFSSILKLEINTDGQENFHDFAKNIRQQFLNDMKHAVIDGVKAKRIGKTGEDSHIYLGNSVEVAYSSGFGVGKKEKTEVGLAQIGWKPMDDHLQTPGVLVDFQVFFAGEEICIHFDIDRGRLGKDTCNAMFDSFCELIETVAGDDNWEKTFYPKIPESQLNIRNDVNNTTTNFELTYLHELFDINDNLYNCRIIKSYDKTVSQSELDSYLQLISSYLIKKQVGNNPVAIIQQKSWQQIVSSIGVSMSGAIFVPVDPKWPADRIYSVLKKTDCKLALVDALGKEKLETLHDGHGLSVHAELIDEILNSNIIGKGNAPELDAENTAYVIFTSGSTGEPKGVAISHISAANTIADMIDRFDITADDSVLGVSALHFDLSIFDIFGVLGKGGKLVLPPDTERPEPQILSELIVKEEITIWNTVPAIMEMVVEHTLHSNVLMPSLRYVFLSGDWIPLDLPNKIHQVCPNATIVSLGGATEASIWSNLHTIIDIPDNWKSIPYGTPLSNQTLDVIDRRGELCPDWVEGDLVIGGKGLAKKYWELTEETSKKFVTSKFNGQRIYITGDRAKRWSDGTIEFLGRNDSQIKINGYRVELGDISSALKKCSNVKNTVVMPVGVDIRKSIVGFVTPRNIETESVMAQLNELLPSYMVPEKIIALDEIPLSKNGKVNYRQLQEIANSVHSDNEIVVAQSKIEKLIINIWIKLLNYQIEDINTGFFGAGGDSLLAVRLTNELESEFGVKLTIADVLRFPTVKTQASLIKKEVPVLLTPLLPLKVSSENKPVMIMVHPVGGTVYCYRELVKLLSNEFNIYGLQSIGINEKNISITEMTKIYVRELIKSKIDVSHIMGWSFGGIVATEMQNLISEYYRKTICITLVDPWISKGKNQAISEDALNVSFINDVLLGKYNSYDRKFIENELKTKSIYEIMNECSNQSIGNRLSKSDIEILRKEFVSNTNALLVHTATIPKKGTIWIAENQAESEFPYLNRLVNVDTEKLPGIDVSIKCLSADHYTVMDTDNIDLIASDILKDTEKEDVV